jgi:hypothetical protein
MRHINGVYTQRHNRLGHTDGPLFRGRYQAIQINQMRAENNGLGTRIEAIAKTLLKQDT